MWLLIACLVTSWSLFWPRRHWSLCVRSWPSFGLEHGCTRCVFAVKFYVFWKTKPSLVSLSNFDALFMHVSFVSFTLFMHFMHFFFCISYQLFMQFLCTFYAFFMYFLAFLYTFYALFMPLQKAHKKCIHFLKKCMHFLCTF